MANTLLGAIAMASLVAALLFARFWRTTRDRFFLFFAASFGVEAVNRFLMAAFSRGRAEEEPLFYTIRLFAFLIIVVAIAEKNRRPTK